MLLCVRESNDILVINSGPVIYVESKSFSLLLQLNGSSDPLMENTSAPRPSTSIPTGVPAPVRPSRASARRERGERELPRRYSEGRTPHKTSGITRQALH